MTQETKTPKQPATPAPPKDEGLPEAIAQAVAKQADEEIRVVRVFADRYRCNWWVRDRAAHWLSHTTGTIRRSTFYKATQTADGLLIEDLDDHR